MNIQDRVEHYDSLIDKHLKKFTENNLFSASLQHFTETGKASGSFRESLHKMMGEVARLIPEAKGHGFCEKPGHVCTMNYCDENGCQERKRVLVPEAPTPSDFKTARKFERFIAKDKESIAPIVEESQVLLWKRALNHSGSKIDPIKWLSDNFIITRKP